MHRLAFIALLSPACLAGEEPIQTIRARTAVSKALPYLARDGRAWMDGKVGMQNGKKCVSCHYTAFGVWSHNAASLAGIKIDRDKNTKLNADAMQFIRDPKVGRLVTYSHMTMANPQAANDVTKELLVEFSKQIVATQEKDGYWQAKGQFPTQDRDVMESNAVATMWALAATKRFEQNEAVKASRTRAIKWLRDSKPGTTAEWLAWRLIIAQIEKEPQTAKLSEKLISLQKKDGGWSWLKANTSDAYTTGQVLYALRQPGMKPDNKAFSRGTQFLLETQQADGTWKVPSELISAGPDDNKDQIYSYWGTAWAVIAISDALPRQNGVSSADPANEESPAQTRSQTDLR